MDLEKFNMYSNTEKYLPDILNKILSEVGCFHMPSNISGSVFKKKQALI